MLYCTALKNEASNVTGNFIAVEFFDSQEKEGMVKRSYHFDQIIGDACNLSKNACSSPYALVLVYYIVTIRSIFTFHEDRSR